MAARNVTFVCLHGSAKSLIAAELANRLAKERGLTVRFHSGGTEPDAEVPPHVVAGLRSDGIDVSATVPASATPAALSGTSLVVSFGPDVQTLAPAGVPIEQWDVPNVSDGYGPARDAIRLLVEQLVSRI